MIHTQCAALFSLRITGLSLKDIECIYAKNIVCMEHFNNFVQPNKIFFAPFLPPKMIQYFTPELMPRGVLLLHADLLSHINLVGIRDSIKVSKFLIGRPVFRGDSRQCITAFYGVIPS